MLRTHFSRAVPTKNFLGAGQLFRKKIYYYIVVNKLLIKMVKNESLKKLMPRGYVKFLDRSVRRETWTNCVEPPHPGVYSCYIMEHV